MSKEKNFLENDFVSYRNEKIVFCKDGRIFSIDKDTELVDLRDCENCKQKDQRIEVINLKQHEQEIRKPLEEEIERLLQEIKDLECLVKLKEQSKQEVIAELEEWVKENRHEVTASVGGFDYYVNDTEDLNQKLNEMKGEQK